MAWMTIPPTFLKALGPIALDDLLSIFNIAFELSICPQICRQAIINLSNLPYLLHLQDIRAHAEQKTFPHHKVQEHPQPVSSRIQQDEGVQRQNCENHPRHRKWMRAGPLSPISSSPIGFLEGFRSSLEGKALGIEIQHGYTAPVYTLAIPIPSQPIWKSEFQRLYE